MSGLAVDALCALDEQRRFLDAFASPLRRQLDAFFRRAKEIVGERLQDSVPLEETWMGRQGSDHFGGLVDYEDRYRPGAIRFDVGEASNFALMPMLEASLDLLLELGVENISAYCGRLTSGISTRLADAGFGIDRPEERAPHLFGIRLPVGQDPGKIQRNLAAQKIVVSVRGNVVRVAPNVYNDESDMARLEEVLCG